ncbi:hypothetical protein D9615_006598 [Tricholomella constricta]|uniref:PHD-type domain-containing protein n=1 Tax=Tricholomella constricta TaxID=117010 RepID=A0A8H5H9Z5_9AGAR|nr:hypothetical protein D9615_006598 [Tricholomella constricta]
MVLGFLKHVYRYFVPVNLDEHERASGVQGPLIPGQSSFSMESNIPIYDQTGRILGYVQHSHPPSEWTIPVTASMESKANISVAKPHVVDDEVLYSRTPDGKFIPVTAVHKSSRVPQSQALHETKRRRVEKGEKQGTEKDEMGDKVEWDGWPDGKFERDFMYSEVRGTNSLVMHWAHTVGGGDRRGDVFADEWEKGKKATRKCLGVIECDNFACEVTVRPNTRPDRLGAQLSKSCSCGAVLSWKQCGVRSILWTWKGGIHYSHEGEHFHRPPHKLHLLPEEGDRFEALVKSHPKAGPLQLIVGVPGVHGPGDSVADISDVLLNADRVSKERKSVKRGADTDGDSFIRAFSDFEVNHPGFIIASTLGRVTVISLQTKFMRSQLLKEEILNEPVNGMVNDAAHGWWKERTSLLMVTSTYCPVLSCWVPGMLSFTNGATTDHFMHHFLAVFQGIVDEAEVHGMEIEDRLFAGVKSLEISNKWQTTDSKSQVMDFSEAERSGFITAFTEFWYQHPNNARSRAELEAAAQRLLRGCEEHFRAGVTRVSRISGAVPPEMSEEFVQRALSLLKASDSEDFRSCTALLARDFPKLVNWINWWSRESHAMMLFGSERKMDVSIWESLPATNNAEEAMHWKLYSACGRNHAFLEGLQSLYKFALYYERRHAAALRNRQDLKNLIVSIPISFRVEIEDDYRQNSEVEQQLWNFPASFSLHISSTTEDQQVIYTYDGMKNGGFSIQEPGALFSTHLAGKNVSLPDEYDTHQAFYHLRGGLKAQAEFYRLQTDTYREKFDLVFFPQKLVSSFSVTYTGKDMQPMNKADRFWMQKPTHRPTTEYLSTKLADAVDSASDPAESEEETRQSARHKGLKTAVSFYAPIHQIPSSPSRLPSTPPAIATSELSSLSSLKSPAPSLPNSEFCIDCRCGLAGDGNIFYNGVEGRAIQCDECRDWSHVACRKNGRAGNLRENEPFICDKCTITPFLLPTRVSKRKKTISHPLKDRLREGCGALARQGEFWYPVRLIQPQEGGSRWQVRWWRGCNFEMNQNVADSFSVVDQRDIVDSLWMDRTERRKIRLGKWLHGWEVQTSEDVLADPSSMPYTDKVEKALSIFKDVLWTLLTTPKRVSSLKVPAKGWLESQKKNLTNTMIPYVGSLSIVERAQISNWFEAHISKDPKLRKHWLGLLPIAHAHTLFIASCLKMEPRNRDLAESDTLKKAWSLQLTGVPSVWTDVDVDRECLDLLEEQMFEISSQAGIAGHYQWGLDAGAHQAGWNPYAGAPPHWNHGDRDGSDTELEHGSKYISFRRPTPPVVDEKVRPKPRPKGRK